MDRWLHLLPEEEIQRSPTLLCARVWILQTHGQHGDLARLLMAIAGNAIELHSDYLKNILCIAQEIDKAQRYAHNNTLREMKCKP